MEFETLATGYDLVEGPRTDDQNRLYYSDVRGGGVFRRNPDGRIETLIPDRKSVGGIALNEGGGLIVTGQSLAHWDEQTGRMRDLFAEWEGKPIFGLNDLATDDQSSIWSGTFGCDIQKFDFKSAPPTGWASVRIGSFSTIAIRPRVPSGRTKCARIGRSVTANSSRGSPKGCPMG